MSSGASISDRILKGAPVVWARVREKLAAMSLAAKVFVATTAISAIVLLGWLSYRSTETTWAVLFANLDREDAAAVVAKLKEQKVPYRIEGDGGTIEVPQANSRELRLELAGAGLPRGGGVGFESFDKPRLGATEFEQRVLFRRSLEGELARTIDTLSAVQSARVHLVLPERSVFVQKTEPSSASVVLRLRGGRTLGAGEIAGIVHLVSSSVAGLSPDRVAVVTTEGAMLHRPRRGGEGAFDEDDTSVARSLESTLEERARTMLEKLAGSGHVDVRVSVEMDRARVERVEDHYDPAKTALRSEERSTERRTEEAPTAAGVPGAESNLPGGTGRLDGGVASDLAIRDSHTRNFEVDHVLEKRLTTSGVVRRVSVAVVLDSSVKGGGARSKEDLERIGALVRSAVGADDKRGDLVTIDAAPFAESEPAAPAVVAPPIAVPPSVKKWAPFAGAGVGLVAVFAMLLSLRRGKKRRRIAAEAKAEAPVIPVSPIPELPAMPIIPELDAAEVRRQANERATQDPATAALIVKRWIDGFDGGPTTASAEGAAPKSAGPGATLAS